MPCRIACVRIGRFAIGALAPRVPASPAGDSARGSPTGRGASAEIPPPSGATPPRVLVADVRGAPRVVAACARAARAGIVPDMALAQAKAFASDLVAVPWDEERLARAALEVTTALLAASPRVTWERGSAG